MKKSKTFIKIITFAAALFAFQICFSGCNNNSENPEENVQTDDDVEEIENLELSDVYGWKYRCVFTSSSGNVMKPSIIIYNAQRLDWDMSENSIGVMQYFYTSELTSQNAYKTWWYKNEAEMIANDKSTAAMVVTIGIQSKTELHVLASSANEGAGSSMTGTPLVMTRVSEEKNTTPSEIESSDSGDSDGQDAITDISITVPESAVSASWIEDSSTFTGTFNWIVASYSGKGRDHKTDDEYTSATVKITKTENNTVTITSHSFYNTFVMEMYLGAWEIQNVKVVKDGDDYYFYLDKADSGDTYSAVSHGIRYSDGSEGSTDKDEDFTIHGKSLVGKYSGGTFTLRNEFAPGSMPLNIVAIFTGSEEE